MPGATFNADGLLTAWEKASLQHVNDVQLQNMRQLAGMERAARRLLQLPPQTADHTAGTHCLPAQSVLGSMITEFWEHAQGSIWEEASMGRTGRP